MITSKSTTKNKYWNKKSNNAIKKSNNAIKKSNNAINKSNNEKTARLKYTKENN